MAHPPGMNGVDDGLGRYAGGTVLLGTDDMLKRPMLGHTTWHR